MSPRSQSTIAPVQAPDTQGEWQVTAMSNLDMAVLILLGPPGAGKGTQARMLKMEELLSAVRNLDSPEAEDYFAESLGFLGIGSLPDDWRERVRVGSDRRQSGTARENLAGPANDVPAELPEM